MTQGFSNFFFKTWLQNEPSLNHQLREALKNRLKGGGGQNYDIREVSDSKIRNSKVFRFKDYKCPFVYSWDNHTQGDDCM